MVPGSEGRPFPKANVRNKTLKGLGEIPGTCKNLVSANCEFIFEHAKLTMYVIYMILTTRYVCMVQRTGRGYR